MQLCATFTKMQKERYVDFDPMNPEHQEVYRDLCLGNYEGTGVIHVNQHPTLRFNLEIPFLEVPAMMHHKVGKAFLEIMKSAQKEVEEVK